MGADRVSVINRALGFIGERAISNPDAPETPAGKRITDAFDQCRQEVICRVPWNFAETWATCSITTAPPFGYTDAYSLPADCLRILIVGDPTQPLTDYRILNQGSPDYRKVIACNNAGKTTLPIAYNADITILSQWSPLALKVLAIWLALDAAKALTGQDELVKLLDELLTKELQDAVAVDGQEQPIRESRFSYVQEERDLANYGGNGYGWTNVVGYN